MRIALESANQFLIDLSRLNRYNHGDGGDGPAATFYKLESDMAEVVHEQDLMDSVTVQPKKRTTDSDDALDTVTLVLMRGRDPTGSIGSGVQYQRCGGGRRILKKRIGGN